MKAQARAESQSRHIVFRHGGFRASIPVYQRRECLLDMPTHHKPRCFRVANVYFVPLDQNAPDESVFIYKRKRFPAIERTFELREAKPSGQPHSHRIKDGVEDLFSAQFVANTISGASTYVMRS